MGWYDYFVNQNNNISFEYEIYTASPYTRRYSVPAGQNVLLSRDGWCALWMKLIQGDRSYNVWFAPANSCQNFEFILNADGRIARWDGYTYRPPGPIEQQYPQTVKNYFFQAPATSLNHRKQREKALEMVGTEATQYLKEMIKHNRSFSDIFIAVANEFGLERLVKGILHGPAEWSYQALLHLRLDDSQSESLLRKTATNSKWAFYAVRDVPNLEPKIQQDLLSKVASEPKWAKLAMENIDNLGEAQAAIEEAAAQADE